MSVAPAHLSFTQLTDAVDVAAAHMRAFSDRIAKASRQAEWTLTIAFTDEPKLRRRLIRDMAREYRRPALIHKGGKP